MELCGVKSLSFAVGLYLPLSTTLPIWIGGALKGLTDWWAKSKGEIAEDAELGKGSLFATGLVAGGALAGVIVALFQASDGTAAALERVNLQGGIVAAIGENSFNILGVLCFATLAFFLIRASRMK